MVENPKQEQDEYADWLLDGEERQPFLELGRELGEKHHKEGNQEGVRSRIVREALTLVSRGFVEGASAATEEKAGD